VDATFRQVVLDPVFPLRLKPFQVELFNEHEVNLLTSIQDIVGPLQEAEWNFTLSA